ncbi:MAG: chemotaxis protein CheY-P-specific phosphatase CheC [Candidatus Azotimanducaceae bacterium]|jgi:chemotaxis protein CheY-P-specific phosphatase CheC
MPVPIVICDDSNMARKHMRRCLPKDWDVYITFAENGEEAIAALEQGLGAVLFLDLTMPVMDGYETLASIRAAELDTMVIVVSGDVQEEAYKRVMAMGAMDFIKKPADLETVRDILDRYGIHRGGDLVVLPDLELAGDDENEVLLTQLDLRFDRYREITNIAVGRAAKLLSQLTNEFVTLPIPKVNLLEVSELQMVVHSSSTEAVSAVCQGFIAPGIAGEALLVIGDSDLQPMIDTLGHKDASAIEVLSDISGILLGAILKGLGEQLHLTFSQSYPMILGVHVETDELIENNFDRWKKTLAIEITYEIPSVSISCEVLLLLTEQSMETIDERLV